MRWPWTTEPAPTKTTRWKVTETYAADLEDLLNAERSGYLETIIPYGDVFLLIEYEWV